MFDVQTTAFLLDAAAQTAEQAEGLGVKVIPMAVGAVVAILICGFFMRYAMKKGEYDRMHDPDRYKRKNPNLKK